MGGECTPWGGDLVPVVVPWFFWGAEAAARPRVARHEHSSSQFLVQYLHGYMYPTTEFCRILKSRLSEVGAAELEVVASRGTPFVFPNPFPLRFERLAVADVFLPASGPAISVSRSPPCAPSPSSPTAASILLLPRSFPSRGRISGAGGGKFTNELLPTSGWNIALDCGSGGIAPNMPRTFLRERRTPTVLDGVWGGDECMKDACLCPIGCAETARTLEYRGKEEEAGSGAGDEAFPLRRLWNIF